MKWELSYHLRERNPDFAAVYIHATEHAGLNRKYFYDLAQLGNMLHEHNKLVQTFVSLRDPMNTDQIPEDVKLVIYAHERTKPGHERKYNVLEASGVVALIVGEQYCALDIVLRRRG